MVHAKSKATWNADTSLLIFVDLLVSAVVVAINFELESIEGFFSVQQ